MAVTMYTGLPGAGKSYEIVRSAILEALAKGRVVVSNIDGLDTQAIREYVERTKGECTGDLQLVDRKELARPDFFPKRQDDGTYRPSPWVPNGAMIVIDEAHFVWGSEKMPPREHIEFLKEHRHCTGTDEVACDVIIASQTLEGVHRAVKALVQFRFHCRKLAVLGLNKKYTVITYEGAKQAEKYVVSRETKSYDKAIFPLYRSFQTANGRIVQTDARMSIWRNKTFIAGLVIAPLFLVYGVWKLKSRFFDAPPAAAVVASPPVGAVPGAGARPGALAAAAGRADGVPVGIGKGIGGEDDAQASPWRVVGAVRFDKHDWAVLRRKGFALRYVPLSACVLSFGLPIECKLAGEVFMPDIKPTGEAPPPAMAALANHLGNKP